MAGRAGMVLGEAKPGWSPAKPDVLLRPGVGGMLVMTRGDIWSVATAVAVVIMRGQ